MSCLVVLLGFAVGLFALVIIVALIQSAFPAVLGGAIVEIILLPVFVLCLIKYYSNPKYKEKKQKKENKNIYVKDVLIESFGVSAENGQKGPSAVQLGRI